MTERIKIEWTEPGPEQIRRLVVFPTGEYPTEDDLTRALKCLPSDMRRRVVGDWSDVRECFPTRWQQRIASLERELEEAKDLAGRMAVQAEEWREQAAKDKAVLGAVVDAMRRAVG